MHTNVAECVSNHSVHDVTLISAHQCQNFVFELCANVGVMFILVSVHRHLLFAYVI